MASHARFGQTKRSQIMYDTPGLIYVYMIYGLHFMFNIVAHKNKNADDAGAVLIRQIYDLENKTLIDGPAKLTKHLQIDKTFNYKKIGEESGIYICDYGIRPKNIKKLKRVGIDYAKKWKDKLLRFKYEF